MDTILSSMCRRAVVATASLFFVTALQAANAELDAARARYQQELALCNSGQSSQDVDACRLEARNALAEIQRGRVEEASPAQYRQNALQRCQVHSGDDRIDCEARIRGEGRTEGSVEGGGILREMQRIVPGK